MQWEQERDLPREEKTNNVATAPTGSQLATSYMYYYFYCCLKAHRLL